MFRLRTTVNGRQVEAEIDARTSLLDLLRERLALGADARYIAGGTTLYDLMKLDIEPPEMVCTAVGGLGRGQAVLGQSDHCTAVSPGDWPVALTAMDGSIEVLGPAGARTLPIAAMYRLPGDTPQLKFTLAPVR